MSRKSPASIARQNNALLQTLYQDYMQRFSNRDFDGALVAIRKARKISAAPEIARAEALCLTRLGQYAKAYAIAKPLPAQALGVNYLDLMSELCGYLGRFDEARNYGSRALQKKDEDAAAEPHYQIPNRAPPQVSADNKRQNVIAYTLFGTSPRYCEGAILNCQTADLLLPHWTCRFYCDNTVPDAIRQRLSESGGDVVLLDPATRERIHPLMWRFLVVDDPSVSRFLVRDADSLIGLREQAAVEAWIDSGKWFHLMRDWYTHSELILAGMWGGCTGVFPDMAGEIDTFLKTGTFAASHVDQHFLRKRIWPTIKQSLLSHDSQFVFLNNQPFPFNEDEPIESEYHVGANMGASAIEGEIDAPDGAIVRWTIHDDGGREVCSYRSSIRAKHWRESIPVSYSRKIRNGGWTVKTHLLPS